jgi:DNA-binding NarL/FixJ family response regulator
VATDPARPPGIRLLLADDHAVVRRGLRLVLESEGDMRVVCEAGDGAEAIQAALDNDLDLAVLDITMPVVGGLEVAREIALRRPRMRIVMLSVHDDDQYVAQAMRAGAHGYVRKSAADHDLLEACRRVVHSQEFVEPRTAPGPKMPPTLTGDDQRLTAREAQVLALVAQGHSAKQIANLLVISPRTVERHRENLMHKLDVHTTAELTRQAIRLGLVEA